MTGASKWKLINQQTNTVVLSATVHLLEYNMGLPHLAVESFVKDARRGCLLLQPQTRTFLPGHWSPTQLPGDLASLPMPRGAAATFPSEGSASNEDEHVSQRHTHTHKGH